MDLLGSILRIYNKSLIMFVRKEEILEEEEKKKSNNSMEGDHDQLSYLWLRWLKKKVKYPGRLVLYTSLSLILFFLVLLIAAFIFPDSVANSSLIRSTANTITAITSTITLSKNEPLPFTCTPPHIICPSSPLTPPPPSPKKTKLENLPSCPQYFRWIHEDLRPWKSSGITREMVDKATESSDFRLTITDGKVYIETFHRSFQTRDVFTLWGIIQLLRMYPGRIPDLDLAFNCGDMPVVLAGDNKTAGVPPVFHYCKDDATVDIVFPDWSFWGWPEVNIKPWVPLMKDLTRGNKRVGWAKRKPYAYWKGNSDLAENRQDLMKCNVSNGREWNARLYRQNWEVETRNGFKKSDLASQCTHRYKIYIEGRAWSVSAKYILACNSPTLLVNTPYHDFFTRGLEPGKHYWPIKRNDKCRSIKFAVDWGNAHQKEAQEMGREGSSFVQEQLKLEYVYDYMFHLLTEYAKLLKYKPTKPPKAVEVCLESMACPVKGLEKDYLIESMVRSPKDSGPCRMPPPFEPSELEFILKNRQNAIKKIELMKQEAWKSHHR